MKWQFFLWRSDKFPRYQWESKNKRNHGSPGTTSLSRSRLSLSFCLSLSNKTICVIWLQDEGWPLGLRPLNARVGLIRNRDLSGGSVSFSTLITASPTSSIASSSSSSSSDLETEVSIFLQWMNDGKIFNVITVNPSLSMHCTSIPYHHACWLIILHDFSDLSVLFSSF